MGQKYINIVEQLPRWLLVLLAALGVYLMHQKFNTIERAIETHEKEIKELMIISTKLSVTMERKN